MSGSVVQLPRRLTHLHPQAQRVASLLIAMSAADRAQWEEIADNLFPGWRRYAPPAQPAQVLAFRLPGQPAPSEPSVLPVPPRANTPPRRPSRARKPPRGIPDVNPVPPEAEPKD